MNNAESNHHAFRTCKKNAEEKNTTVWALRQASQGHLAKEIKNTKCKLQKFPSL